MATIPLSIARRRLDAGNAVQYSQGSPVGGAMQGLGDQLSAVAERYQQMKDQQEVFDAELARRRFNGRIAQAEDEAAANAPPDGAGLYEAMYGQVDPRNGQVVKSGLFDTLFDDALPGLPESQRANFARQKEAMRAVGARRMARRQLQRRDDYELTEWTKVDNISTSSIAQSDPNDTANFEVIRQNGFDLISKIGNPLIRQTAELAWRSNTAKALVQAMIAQDPKRAAEMLGTAQVGVRTKDDMAEAIGDPHANTTSSAASKGDRLGKPTPEERVAQIVRDDISAADRPALADQARAADAARQIETRTSLGLAEQNAPAIISDTGTYSGLMPTPEQFVALYGAPEGVRRFQAFNRAIDVSRQFYSMRGMSNETVQTKIRDAAPKEGSTKLEEDKAHHEAIATAAELTFKARQDDPGGYVRKIFATLDAAWNNLSKPEDYQAAIIGSIAAQQQLGLEKIQPLPNSVAEGIADTLRDQNRPSQETGVALRNVLIATPPEQRPAVLDHLLQASVFGVADNMAARSRQVMEEPLADGREPLNQRGGGQALGLSDIANRIVPTYGNYGGPGWTGGAWRGDFKMPPADIQDGFYKQHDTDYRDAITLDDKIAADKKLVVSLRAYLKNGVYLKDPGLGTDRARDEAVRYAMNATIVFERKIAAYVAIRDEAQKAYDDAQSAVGRAHFENTMSFGDW
ncbi:MULTISPECIES: hypothetical protein [unclassified Mesorhizobium]|uniref:hypothetical protein n=1 Tax=unclassified Mesorhizobium TaxID=325217 RepID=UPI0019CF82DD|nr:MULTISPECIES: hypothetical protein [unclassified Mesorhizobium]